VTGVELATVPVTSFDRAGAAERAARAMEILRMNLAVVAGLSVA
jgi:hypothetical protein